MQPVVSSSAHSNPCEKSRTFWWSELQPGLTTWQAVVVHSHWLNIVHCKFTEKSFKQILNMPLCRNSSPPFQTYGRCLSAMFCRVLIRAVRCPLSPAPALHLPQMAPSNPGVNLCDLLVEAVDADAKSSDSEKSCSSYRYTIYIIVCILLCVYIYIYT